MSATRGALPTELWRPIHWEQNEGNSWISSEPAKGMQHRIRTTCHLQSVKKGQLVQNVTTSKWIQPLPVKFKLNDLVWINVNNCNTLLVVRIICRVVWRRKCSYICCKVPAAVVWGDIMIQLLRKPVVAQSYRSRSRWRDKSDWIVHNTITLR